MLREAEFRISLHMSDIVIPVESQVVNTPNEVTVAPGTEQRCPFCDPEPGRVFLRYGTGLAMWTGNGPPGSAMILPVAHRRTPFDLTRAEWADSRQLLITARAAIQARYDPDGWNIGWNVNPVAGQSVPHVHCHLIPRYASDPTAGRGIRWWLTTNRSTPSARLHGVDHTKT